MSVICRESWQFQLGRHTFLLEIKAASYCAVEVVKWDMVGECLDVCVHGCLCIRGRNGRVKKGGIISSEKLADKLHTPL